MSYRTSGTADHQLHVKNDQYVDIMGGSDHFFPAHVNILKEIDDTTGADTHVVSRVKEAELHTGYDTYTTSSHCGLSHTHAPPLNFYFLG